jgi:predicted transcriptional regulator
MSVTVTTTLEDSTAALLDRVARALGRSREAFIEDAVREYAQEQEELLVFIEEGERDLAEGRVVSQEEVFAWLAGARERAEAEIARRNAQA